MAINGIGRPSKGTTNHTKKIPTTAKKFLRGKKVKLTKRDLKLSKIKYNYEEWNCPTLLRCDEGYDILENLYFARHYIVKKYKIQLIMIETLLFLYPKNYFTFNEYFPLTHFSYKHRRPQPLINDGIIKVVASPNNVNRMNFRKQVFCLTDRSKEIVREFYGLLSGEVKYEPEILKDNGILRDQRRLELLKDLNKLPVRPSNAKLF